MNDIRKFSNEEIIIKRGIRNKSKWVQTCYSEHIIRVTWEADRVNRFRIIPDLGIFNFLITVGDVSRAICRE